MTDKQSKSAQKISVDLINDNPDHLRQYFKRKDNQMLLEDFTMPAHHPVLDMDISDKEFEVLKNAWEIQPENYEELKNKREESIMVKALKKRFSPEFLNRLDSVCYFNNLSREVLNSILQKEMNEMNKGIKNITHKEVELSEDVRNWMLDKVEIEHNGARPIIRLLEQEIEEEIANLVINESELLEKESDKLIAELENDKIVLR